MAELGAEHLDLFLGVAELVRVEEADEALEALVDLEEVPGADLFLETGRSARLAARSWRGTAGVWHRPPSGVAWHCLESVGGQRCRE